MSPRGNHSIGDINEVLSLKRIHGSIRIKAINWNAIEDVIDKSTGKADW